ncbi:MAG: nucleotidyltransferase domain-containing protein [Candidatus Methanofastidiosia archaeon]
MNTAREGDFLESADNLIFDVKGFCHPPDRVISFVRYVPDPTGDRKRKRKRKVINQRLKGKGKEEEKEQNKKNKKNEIYRKIYALNERYQFLKDNFPEYVYFDPVFQRKLQGVPANRIRKVYNPQEKLQQLLKGTRDTLEDITVLLCKQIGNINTMGVSGSVLVGLHTPKSDIDIIVYGEDTCKTAYERLKVLYTRDIISHYTFEQARLKAQFRWGKATDHLIAIEQKKVMHGLFKGKEFFFRFIKEDYVPYGKYQYIPLHKAQLKAEIADDTDSIFTPSCYTICNSSIDKVVKLVSLRGRYCEQATKGDTITAKGTIEKVVTADQEYYHMVLGEPGDYLIPVQE